MAKINCFDNYFSLKETSLPLDQVAEIRGFYEPGDGGRSFYRIVQPENHNAWDKTKNYQTGDIVTTGYGVYYYQPFVRQLWSAKTEVTGWPGYWDESSWEYIGVSQDLGEPAFIPLPNGNIAQLIYTGQIKPEQFGAKADGITDDYNALRALSAYASSLRNSVEIQMPRGQIIRVHTQNQRHTSVSLDGYRGLIAHPLWFEDIENLYIHGNGCKIIQPGGYTTKYLGTSTSEGTTLDDYRYPFSGIQFWNCKRVEVRDLTLDGGAKTLERGVDTTTGNPHPELDSHGLNMNGVYTMQVRNVDCIGFISDGILLDVYKGRSQRFHNDGEWRIRNSTNIEIEDSNCDFNQRQGMSVVGARRCVFRRCTFTNTTKGPYGGHSPGAGIDIERDYWIGDPRLDGISVALPPEQNVGELLFEDCTIRANGRAFVCRYETQEYIYLRRCSIYGDPNPGNRYDIDIGSPNTFIEDCYFETYQLFGLNSVIQDNDQRVIRLDRCEIRLRVAGEKEAPDAGQLALTGGNNIFLYDCLVRSYVPNYSTAILFSKSGTVERCEFWKSKDVWDDALPYNPHTSIGNSKSNAVLRDCRFTSDMVPRSDNKRWVILINFEVPTMYGMKTDATVRWQNESSSDPPHAFNSRYSEGGLFIAGRLLIKDQKIVFDSQEPTMGYWGKGSRIFDTEGKIDRWQCITAGFATDTAWEPEKAVRESEIIHHSDRVYEVTEDGTTDTSPPTFEGFNVQFVNGTATFQYIGPKAIFREFNFD